MKRGSFILGIFLIVETICFFQFSEVFTESIIDWYGAFRLEMMVYWIIHVSVLFTILHIYFLKSPVNVRLLLIVLMTYLVVRALYDFGMCKFLDHKLNSFLFTLSKISFFGEIAIQLFLLAILFISAYLKCYRFTIKRAWLLSGIIIICILCVFLNLYITNFLIEIKRMSGKKTISMTGVTVAFAYDLIFEKIITLLAFLAVFWNLKKKDAIS